MAILFSFCSHEHFKKHFAPACYVKTSSVLCALCVFIKSQKSFMDKIHWRNRHENVPRMWYKSEEETNWPNKSCTAANAFKFHVWRVSCSFCFCLCCCCFFKKKNTKQNNASILWKLSPSHWRGVINMTAVIKHFVFKVISSIINTNLTKGLQCWQINFQCPNEIFLKTVWNLDVCAFETQLLPETYFSNLFLPLCCRRIC